MIYFVVGIAIAISVLLWKAQNQMDALSTAYKQSINSLRQSQKETILEMIDIQYNIEKINSDQLSTMTEYITAIAIKVSEISNDDDVAVMRKRLKELDEKIIKFVTMMDEVTKNSGMDDATYEKLKSDIGKLYEPK